MGNILAREIEPNESKLDDHDTFETKYEVRNGKIEYIGGRDGNYPREQIIGLKRANSSISMPKKRRIPPSFDPEMVTPKVQKLMDGLDGGTIIQENCDESNVQEKVLGESQLAGGMALDGEIKAEAPNVDSGKTFLVRPWESSDSRNEETGNSPILQACPFEKGLPARTCLPSQSRPLFDTESASSKIRSPFGQEVLCRSGNFWENGGLAPSKYSLNIHEYNASPYGYDNDSMHGHANNRSEYFQGRNTQIISKISGQGRSFWNVQKMCWDESQFSTMGETSFAQGRSVNRTANADENKLQMENYDFDSNMKERGSSFRSSQSGYYGKKPRGKRGGRNRNYNKRNPYSSKGNVDDQSDVVKMTKFVSSMMNAFETKNKSE